MSRCNHVALVDAFQTSVVDPNRNNPAKRPEGLVNLYIDTCSIAQEYPLLLVDTDPSLEVQPRLLQHVSCHEIKTHRIDWDCPPDFCFQDVLLARLVFLFADVICIFADDVGGLAGAGGHLLAWSRCGSASSLRSQVRPRVIVVTSEPRSAATQLLEESITALSVTADFIATFSAMRIEYVEQCGSSACFSDCGHQQSNLLYHASTFINQSMERKVPYDAVASVIASSILLDAYPQGTHWFCPGIVFDVGYAIKVQSLFELAYIGNSEDVTTFASYMTGVVRDHVEHFFAIMEHKGQSSHEIHAKNLAATSSQIQWDYFDLTCGTSAGGLIILGLFAKEWDLSECINTFRRLAGQFFSGPDIKSVPLIPRIQSYIRCLLNDSCYKAEILESGLQESFGRFTRVFDFPPNSLSRHKFAITATNISDASPFIFTNYNGRGDRDRDCGYRHFRPADVSSEPLLWEVGRATSAAPV
ncbi:unnamed protein product [Zymoseptoria tritici ST99CH_1A5]|uniref:PNPLA domain-containing protein n=1 Tax=Zymoseptoria tritici ST99CH_1A5 TaxID=1276529 RepID=A0A1Y6M0I0_ZYMTR|nr:unnamed protein product [Zymoseptoria tritici ST99CH_1A5]